MEFQQITSSNVPGLDPIQEHPTEREAHNQVAPLSSNRKQVEEEKQLSAYPEPEEQIQV